MSACYTIELNMKFNAPESMSDAVRSLQESILRRMLKLTMIWNPMQRMESGLKI